MKLAGKARAGWSLQSWLLALMALATLLAWGSGIAVMASNAQREAGLLHDHELQQIAQLLLHLSEHEIEELAALPIAARISNGRFDTAEALGDNYRYQVWADDGRLLLTNFGLPSPSAMARFGGTAYSMLSMDGADWRIYALRDQAGRLQVQVAERAARRNWALSGLERSFLAVALLSLGIVLLPSIWLLHRVMKPLRDLASELQQRSPAHLQPVQVAQAPRELTPVVAAINRLFGRVAEAIRRESAFTALAAHELRTPHATLRVLAESVRSARNDGERAQAVEALILTSDRCTHLQDQLLTLSRLDAAGTADAADEVELVDLVTDVFADLLALARRRQIKLISHLDGAALVAHRFGVQTLLGNLLGNAVRYTPQHGRVAITTATHGADVVVQVDDSGPGVPGADRERIFERFERLRGVHESGAGLGLSIVRTVADAHGATVTLGDSPLGGLRVEVVFKGRAVQRAALLVAEVGAELP